MPSVSKKQHNLMAMVANDPAAAKRVGVPQSVGAEFMKADKGLKFGKGPRTRPDLQKINKPETRHGKSELFSEGGRMAESKKMVKKEVAFMKKAGAPKSMIKHEQEEVKGVKKMRVGGWSVGTAPGRVTSSNPRPVHPLMVGRPYVPQAEDPSSRFRDSNVRQAPPPTTQRPFPTKVVPYAARGLGSRGRYAEGGLTSGHKAADGIASKGKTKGKEVKMGASKPLGMKRGGKC